MIKVFFIKPYNESLSFLFDDITIGQDPKSDIIIPSDKFNLPEIYLKIKKEKLEVSTNQKDLFFLHNQKKVSGKIRLKPQDTVSFEFCEFKIVNFIKEMKQNNENEFEKNYQDLTKKENEEEKKIIEMIEKNIFIIEKELN